MCPNSTPKSMKMTLGSPPKKKRAAFGNAARQRGGWWTGNTLPKWPSWRAGPDSFVAAIRGVFHTRPSPTIRMSTSRSPLANRSADEICRGAYFQYTVAPVRGKVGLCTMKKAFIPPAPAPLNRPEGLSRRPAPAPARPAPERVSHGNRCRPKGWTTISRRSVWPL